MEKKETWQRVVKTSLYIALPIKNKARRISLPDFFNDVMQKEAAEDVGAGKYERIVSGKDLSPIDQVPSLKSRYSPLNLDKHY